MADFDPRSGIPRVHPRSMFVWRCLHLVPRGRVSTTAQVKALVWWGSPWSVSSERVEVRGLSDFFSRVLYSRLVEWLFPLSFTYVPMSVQFPWLLIQVSIIKSETWYIRSTKSMMLSKYVILECQWRRSPQRGISFTDSTSVNTWVFTY
jgi:hypothetical protein